MLHLFCGFSKGISEANQRFDGLKSSLFDKYFIALVRQRISRPGQIGQSLDAQRV